MCSMGKGEHEDLLCSGELKSRIGLGYLGLKVGSSMS